MSAETLFAYYSRAGRSLSDVQSLFVAYHFLLVNKGLLCQHEDRATEQLPANWSDDGSKVDVLYVKGDQQFRANATAMAEEVEGRRKLATLALVFGEKEPMLDVEIHEYVVPHGALFEKYRNLEKLNKQIEDSIFRMAFSPTAHDNRSVQSLTIASSTQVKSMSSLV